MADDVLIRHRYREEFEQAGLEHVKRTLYAGNYSEAEKIKHARAWIDEKEHGEERAYRAEQMRLAARADHRGVVTMWTAVVAIAISLVSLGFALEPRFRGSASGHASLPAQSQSTPAPALSPK